MKRVLQLFLTIFIVINLNFRAANAQELPDISLTVDFQQWVIYTLADWESDPNLWTIYITNNSPGIAYGVMLDMQVEVYNCAEVNGIIGWGVTKGEDMLPGQTIIYRNDSQFKDNDLRGPKGPWPGNDYLDEFETAVINTGSSLPAGNYIYTFKVLYDSTYARERATGILPEPDIERIYPARSVTIQVSQEEPFFYVGSEVSISQPSAPELDAPGEETEAGEVIQTLIPTFRWYTCGAIDTIIYQVIICEKAPDQPNEEAIDNITFFETSGDWDDPSAIKIDDNGVSGLHSFIPENLDDFTNGCRYVWQVCASSERFLTTGSGFDSESEIYCFQYVSLFYDPTEILTLEEVFLPEETPLLPQFSWNPITGANSYRLLVCNEPDTNNIYHEITDITQTNYNYTTQDEPLEFNIEYFAKVIAYHDEDTIKTSEFVSFTPTPPEGAFDLNVSISPAAPLLPQFIWEPMPGANNYRLLICAEQDTNTIFSEIEDIIQPAYNYTASDEPLSYDVTYYVIVKAYIDDVYMRDIPQENEFVPFICESTGLEYNLTWEGPPYRWTWDPIPGAVSYQVFVNDSPDTSGYIWEIVVNQTTLYNPEPPPPLIPNNTYYTWVMGLDGVGGRLPVSMMVSLTIEPQPYNLSTEILPNLALQVSYDVKLSDFEDMSLVFWSTQTSSPSAVYQGAELEYSAPGADRLYYWKVEPVYGEGQLYNLSFMWDIIEGAAKYSVKVNEGFDTSNWIWEGIYYVNSGSYPSGAPVLQPNTNYVLWVQALTADDEPYGPPSETASVLTSALEPIELLNPLGESRIPTLAPTFSWDPPALPQSSLVWSFSTPIFAPPIPLTPANGDQVATLNPTFVWQTGTTTPYTQFRISLQPNMAVPYYQTITGANTITYPQSALPLQYETTYYWQLTALNDNEEPYEPPSVVFNFITPEEPAPPPPPAPPVGFALIAPVGIDVTTDRPTFSWNELEGAAAYLIQVAENIAFTTPLLWEAQVGALSITYGATDPMEFDNEYFWRVCGLDNEGNLYGDFTDIANFNVVSPAPPPVLPAGPTLVSPVGVEVSSTRPTFSWNQVEGSAGYQLQVSADDDFTPLLWESQVGALNTAYGAEDPLVFENEYYWRIRGLDSNGDPFTEFSSTAGFTVTRTYIVNLISPVNTEVSTRTPTFTWQSVEGAAKYGVWVYADQYLIELLWSTMAVTTTSVTYPSQGVPQLLFGNIYYWQAVALNEAGGELGDPSQPAAFTVTNTLIPTLVYPIGGEQVENLNPTFTWNPVEGIERYGIEVSANGDFSQIVMTDDEISTNSWTYPAFNLEVGTIYYWRVTSYDSQGQPLSEPSSQESFITPPYSVGIELNFGP